MQSSAIFASSIILLVPFLYYAASMPDACAAIRDPKFDTTTNCTGNKSSSTGKTCCWREKSYPGQFGRGDLWCQTCKSKCDAKGDCNETCTTPTKQIVLQNPDTAPSGPFAKPEGGVLQVPESNATILQDNRSSNISNSTLAELQSDVEEEQDENNTSSAIVSPPLPTQAPRDILPGGSLEQDESEETEDSNEEGQ